MTAVASWSSSPFSTADAAGGARQPELAVGSGRPVLDAGFGRLTLGEHVGVLDPALERPPGVDGVQRGHDRAGLGGGGGEPFDVAIGHLGGTTLDLGGGDHAGLPGVEHLGPRGEPIGPLGLPPGLAGGGSARGSGGTRPWRRTRRPRAGHART